MRRSAGIALALGALSGTLGAHASPAAAQAVGAKAIKPLPEGWQRSPDGSVLTWEAPVPIRLVDGFIEVHINDTLQLVPTVAKNRRTLSVTIPPHTELSALRVTSGGARIDVREPASAISQRRFGGSPALYASAPALPTLPIADDPGQAGPYSTTEGEYAEPSISIAGLAAPVEMQAVVVAPVGATGPRPIAFFVHGNHSTCYSPQGEASVEDMSAWPCRDGMLPIPSFRGYLDAQHLLASQGVITVSISANGVGGQSGNDHALDAATRAALLREHVSKWAAGPASFSAGAIAGLQGLQPDLQQLLLIGHSRGGDAVNRFAWDSTWNPTLPWRIHAQLLIAPILHERNPIPGVPAVVLMPACDGDVVDLHGQYYVDSARDVTVDTALRSVVFIEGANHNYFNAQWTPGIGPDNSAALDDWESDDALCGTGAPTRLAPAQQRTLGAVYIAAAAHAFLLGRDAVVPLLDGTPVRAESAGDVRVLAHALGAHRTPLLIPSETTEVLGVAGVTAGRCLTARDAGAADACRTVGMGEYPRTPSFGAYVGTVDEPSRTAIRLEWSGVGGQADIQLAGAALDSQMTAVAARVIVPPQTVDNTFSARLADKAGARIELGRIRLDGLPANATSASGAYWAQEVRFPLDPAQIASVGIDLAQLDRLEIVPESAAGQLWILDAWGYRPGLPAAQAKSVVRVDLESVRVVETDADYKALLPASITGDLAEPAVVYYWAYNKQLKDTQKGYLTVGAHTHAFDIPVTIHGDELDKGNSRYEVKVVGVSGVVAGAGTALMAVEDDEITPPVELNAHAVATEGSPLVWTFTLPRPSARAIFMHVRAVAPNTGLPELTLADTEPESEDVPLSEVPFYSYVMLDPGAVSYTLELPTVKDELAEGSESVVLELTDDPQLELSTPGIPNGTRITGEVTDAP